MLNQPCPVCKTEAGVHSIHSGAGAKIACPRCGSFRISGLAAHEISPWSQLQRVNLSGWLREHQEIEIVVADVPHLASLRTPSVGEKAEKVLLRLSKAFPTLGQPISIDKNLKAELLGISAAVNPSEFEFVFNEYLRREMAFLEGEGTKISPKGWVHLHALQQTNIASQQGFIAMWFDDQVIEAWKAIDQGIRAAGYAPLRIDQKQHNNEITDQMIAEIRKSKFLVADLTGHRQNVYYEAGFAKGFGIEVIWLCRKDELPKTQFDTNHFPLIPWEEGKLAELAKALQARIEATIGRGPLAASA